jgi:CHAT domain
MTDLDRERHCLLTLNSIFRQLGWQDSGTAALQLTQYAAGGGSLSLRGIARQVDRGFAERNRTTKAEVARLARETLLSARPTDPRPVSRPTLLLVSADPIDQEALFIQREQREIRDELDKSELRGQIQIEHRPGLIYKDLGRYLLETKPAVVHFSGHGDRDGLYAEDSIGRSRRISARALVSVFGAPVIRGVIRLAILNACYSSVQAQALASQGLAVIGMKASVPDEAAIAFARGLYMGLGKNMSIEDAFAWGRVAITMEDLPAEDSPRLLGTQSARRAKPFTVAT